VPLTRRVSGAPARRWQVEPRGCRACLMVGVVTVTLRRSTTGPDALSALGRAVPPPPPANWMHGLSEQNPPAATRHVLPWGRSWRSRSASGWTRIRGLGATGDRGSSRYAWSWRRSAEFRPLVVRVGDAAARDEAVRDEAVRAVAVRAAGLVAPAAERPQPVHRSTSPRSPAAVPARSLRIARRVSARGWCGASGNRRCLAASDRRARDRAGQTPAARIRRLPRAQADAGRAAHNNREPTRQTSHSCGRPLSP
jgi:hypothetical protein